MRGLAPHFNPRRGLLEIAGQDGTEGRARSAASRSSAGKNRGSEGDSGRGCGRKRARQRGPDPSGRCAARQIRRQRAATAGTRRIDIRRGCIREHPLACGCRRRAAECRAPAAGFGPSTGYPRSRRGDRAHGRCLAWRHRHRGTAAGSQSQYQCTGSFWQDSADGGSIRGTAEHGGTPP